MSEQDKDSLYQKQKTIRPKIEDALAGVLEGERLAHALDFVAYLRANKMSPAWASANSWAVNYKGQRVCYIRAYGVQHWHRLDAGCWHISPNGEYNDDIETLGDALKESIWAGVRYCDNCCNCGPGRHAVILGKDFDNVCHMNFVFTNPDDTALECAKKLVDVRKSAIASK